MTITTKHKNGTMVEYRAVPCPNKHLLLTYDLDEAICQGHIEEGWSIREIHKFYLPDRTEQYARSAIKWALRWLQQHNVNLPASLVREIDG